MQNGHHATGQALRPQVITVTYAGQSLHLAAHVRHATDDLIVFLHGFGCTSASFSAALDSPRFDGFSLCAFDFPSHGASTRLDPALTTLDAYADIVQLVVQQFQPRRVFLVGHSMGGAVAVIAAKEIEGLVSLISIEGNLVAEDCGIVSRGTADQPLEVFVSHGYPDFAASLKTSPRYDLQSWGRWYAQCDPAGIHAAARSLVEWSDSGKLLNLFGQVTDRAYLYGSDSQLEHVLPLLKRTTCRQISSSGHFPMLDNPAEFFPVISNLLQASSKRSEARLVSRGTRV